MVYKEKVVINSKYKNEPQIKQFAKNLPKLFKDGGTILYKARNTIKNFDIELNENQKITISVKSFKKPHLINQFAYAVLRASKAKRSYEYAKKLTSMGINTPTPIAYLEFKQMCFLKYSYYACEHIAVDGEMRIMQIGTLDEHRKMIKQFALFTASLHDAGVLHMDYSPGNILFIKNGDEYTFHLVDINRMKFDEQIGIEKSARNFQKLWGNDDMIAFFVKEYAKYRELDVDSLLDLTFKYRDKFWTTFTKRHNNASPYIG